MVIAVDADDFLRDIGAPLHIVPSGGDAAVQRFAVVCGRDLQPVQDVRHRLAGNLGYTLRHRAKSFYDQLTIMHLANFLS